MSDATTLIQALEQVVTRLPDKEFVRWRERDGYLSLTFREFSEKVEQLAGSFIRLGLNAGDRIAILSDNSVEWAITDYAAMRAGLISVPLYATLPAGQIAYILNDAEARAIVASNAAQAAKVAEINDNCAALEHVIVVEKDALNEVEGSYLFDDLASAPTDDSLDELSSRRAAFNAHDTITFIYTSGTTGNPKGVILTHDNFLSNVQAALRILEITERDTFLSFLPLSHVFERMAGHYLAMAVGATITYSRGLRYLGDELKTVSPTVMACVPRFYESLQEKVLKGVETSPPIRQSIFHWAMRQGRSKSERLRAKRGVGATLGLTNAVAQKLVFHKLQAAVGGRLRFFISGGAPLALSTAEFFHAAGILILEGYGLTETSPVIAVN
ncbi:MAG: AMP-binding protein, partial [Candidatus Poribacteria bacterium]|nr:AMP-binding protein [Candidatus Poribacteria bacterium]